MPTTNILDLNNRLSKLENKPGGTGGDAEDIGYDNSTSHLTADNVQAAIDEVVGDITGLDAEDVAYDNTDSGLTATDVQAAIDEVAGDISGLSADDVSYDNTDSGLTAETVQDAIDEVNEDLGDVTDNLNGFCFYPAGTAIVGLVSDDSPYTDANGNYILAASTTGQGMIDDVTYKSINSTVDARGRVGADTATPFKSGGSDEEPTLLWTNSAPTSNFAPQTISLDLSVYKSVAIMYKGVTSGTTTSIAFYSVGDNITIPPDSGSQAGYPTVICAGYGKAKSMVSMGRDVNITNAGVIFGSGYVSSNVAGNNYSIPLYIWGIKAQIYPTTI